MLPVRHRVRCSLPNPTIKRLFTLADHDVDPTNLPHVVQVAVSDDRHLYTSQ